MPYSFEDDVIGHPGVEIPQLDELIADVRSACKKHGVAFDFDPFSYDRPKLILVPFKAWNADLISVGLAESDDRIPFVRRARAKWQAKADELTREAEAAEERERADSETAAERKLLENGIRLSGGLYRLVRDDTQPAEKTSSGAKSPSKAKAAADGPRPKGMTGPRQSKRGQGKAR